MAGFPFVEYLAALGVAALIGKMGYQLAWEAMQDLIDRGVSVEQQQAYMDTLNSVEDIIDVHLLRSRLMGTDVLIDGHIQVAPTLTVSEAHQINDFATRLLKENHTEITDITLHIDFEPDHRIKKTKLKPMRKTIEAMLAELNIPAYERIYLHYCNNLLNVELVFSEGQDVKKIKQPRQQIPAFPIPFQPTGNPTAEDVEVAANYLATVAQILFQGNVPATITALMGAEHAYAMSARASREDGTPGVLSPEEVLEYEEVGAKLGAVIFHKAAEAQRHPKDEPQIVVPEPSALVGLDGRPLS